MRKAISKFCNFLIVVLMLVSLTYISFFTDIPQKTGNLIKEKIEESAYSYEAYNEDFVINELSITMNSYYYELLTDDQKKIYSALANAVKNFDSEFSVRDYDAGSKEDFADQVSIVIEYFINDHPEVFYLQSQYSSYVVSSFGGTTGYIKLNYTEETQEAIEEKIAQMVQVVNSYVSGLDGLSDYEKEVTIHDRLSYAVEYSDLEELPRAYHTAEGALLYSVGVCDSFTKALQILYDKAGINSIIVLGTLDSNAHAWNLVEIDGAWYHVDLTSSHSIYDETGIVNHAYFNLTTEQIKQSHTIDEENILPSATSAKYNYYVYNDLVIEESDSLSKRLNEICGEFTGQDYIEFYIEGSVSDKISSILVELKKIDSSFVDGSKMYYYNIQNAIVIPKN